MLKQLAENNQKSVYTELTLLLKKLCTILFTSASCGGSFSKLTYLVKTLHHNDPEQLADSFLPFVEQEFLTNVSHKDILNLRTFAFGF